jgi:hypothetical protein
MRPVLVVAIDEHVEARLLLQDVRSRRFGRFQLQRPVHPLVPAVLLWVAGSDALNSNAEAQPHRQFAEPIQGSG